MGKTKTKTTDNEQALHTAVLALCGSIRAAGYQLTNGTLFLEAADRTHVSVYFPDEAAYMLLHPDDETRL